ncbi:hypothetical protein Q3G72_031259 [Acer saccharum]|nr:hypothetical protein Q3G72_031259 [Acer saccharum]
MVQSSDSGGGSIKSGNSVQRRSGNMPPILDLESCRRYRIWKHTTKLDLYPVQHVKKSLANAGEFLGFLRVTADEGVGKEGDDEIKEGAFYDGDGRRRRWTDPPPAF